MAGGDKPLEDFVIITILVKGDVTEYMVPTVSLAVRFLNTLPPFSRSPVPPFF